MTLPSLSGHETREAALETYFREKNAPDKPWVYLFERRSPNPHYDGSGGIPIAARDIEWLQQQEGEARHDLENYHAEVCVQIAERFGLGRFYTGIVPEILHTD